MLKAYYRKKVSIPKLKKSKEKVRLPESGKDSSVE